MRLATLCFCLFPGFHSGAVLAESYTLHSQIRDVTVYPVGNQITRIAEFSIPTGQHLLILPDLPTSIYPEAVRIRIDTNDLRPVGDQDSFRFGDLFKAPHELVRVDNAGARREERGLGTNAWLQSACLVL